MAMCWEDERYVRLYRRDTTTWRMLPWEGRCVLVMLLRAVDRAGVLDLGEDGPEALPATLLLPEEVCGAGLAALVKRGTVVLNGARLVLPNFIAAQDTPQSDRARQRAHRDRARADAMGVTKRDSESRNVTESHAASRFIADGHAPSRDVTPILTEPDRSEPEGTRARARSSAPVGPSEPQSPAMAWEAIRAEAGDRLADRRFRMEDWDRAWTEARKTYSLDDLRVLGRALKAQTVWHMPGAITPKQLIDRLQELLGEATGAGKASTADREAQQRRTARQEQQTREVVAKMRRPPDAESVAAPPFEVSNERT